MLVLSHNGKYYTFTLMVEVKAHEKDSTKAKKGSNGVDMHTLGLCP